MQCPTDHSLTEALMARIAAPVDAASRVRASLHVLDWVVCARAACGDPARQPLAQLYNASAQAGLSLFGPDRPGEAELMLDGVLGSLLEMDDVHRAAVLHPGPVVVPAALLAARQGPVSAEALLDAIVVGYEVMIRIGRGMGRSHYQFWHPTSTLGAFGAAAAVGRLRGLDQASMVWALGNAGTRSGGLWQLRHEPVPSKALHTALAARDGWLAAMLAERGFAGPRHILDGPQGLLAATATDADPDHMLADAEDWLIHEVSFKPWPACRHAHPAIDALLALGQLPPPEHVQRIEVETYQAAVDFCDRIEPTTPAQARFSIQHALAAAMLYGRPCLAQYQPDCIDDARVAAFRSRIKVGSCAELDSAFPNHYGARLRLYLADGSVKEARIIDAWGDPENPLQTEDLVAKCADLLGHAGLAPATIDELVTMTLGLAEDVPLQDWMAAMARIVA